MLDVDPGELLAEFLEAVEVADVLAQGPGLAGRHAAGLVAAVLPDLEFVIGAEPDLPAAGALSLEVLFGDRAPAHQCDGAEFLKDGFTVGGGGWSIHRGNDYLCA